MKIQTDILSKPANDLHRFFYSHTRLHRVVLLVNHLFRAAAMGALMSAMPFRLSMNLAICFASSLFYRLTVETHCAFRFALPSFFGGMAYLQLVNRSYTLALIWAPLLFLQIRSEVQPTPSHSCCERRLYA